MGEWSADWFSGEGAGTVADQDTAPTGAGGDPYGGGDWDMGDTEGASTGVLPGGSDGQYGPLSPNQGFDFTDLLKGGAPSTLPAAWAGAGRGFAGFGTGDFPNLGTTPSVALRQRTNGNGAQSAGDIVRSVRQATGLRVTSRSIVNLIVRYGFSAAARLTGLAAQQLLFLFMRQKGVTHHRRGPGLYTVARRLRAAHRLQATVSRVLGRGGRTRHRRAPYRVMRRRRRRR